MISDQGPASPAWACEDDARRALLRVAQSLPPGPASASVRWRRSGADGFLLASRPSQEPSATGAVSTPDEVIWLAEPGRPAQSAEPFEISLHRLLYRDRSDVSAVVRSRPPFCTTLSCVARIQEVGIPAFHPDFALTAGGSLRCAAVDPNPGAGGFAAFEVIRQALADRTACLLSAWGLLATGATLGAVAQRAAEIESLAQIYWRVLLLDGAPG